MCASRAQLTEEAVPAVSYIYIITAKAYDEATAGHGCIIAYAVCVCVSRASSLYTEETVPAV